jgi:hypothetical protein
MKANLACCNALYHYFTDGTEEKHESQARLGVENQTRDVHNVIQEYQTLNHILWPRTNISKIVMLFSLYHCLIQKAVMDKQLVQKRQGYTRLRIVG